MQYNILLYTPDKFLIKPVDAEVVESYERDKFLIHLDHYHHALTGKVGVRDNPKRYMLSDYATGAPIFPIREGEYVDDFIFFSRDIAARFSYFNTTLTNYLHMARLCVGTVNQ